jgi:hypothetical protein
LNSAVAITAALLATFTGICKVKDDNLVQAMQQSQADKLDHWQYYQARNIREEVARATLVQLRLQKKAAPPALAAEYDEQIEAYEKVSAEQKSKKEELRKSAERDQANYDADQLPRRPVRSFGRLHRHRDFPAGSHVPDAASMAVYRGHDSVGFWSIDGNGRLDGMALPSRRADPPPQLTHREIRVPFKIQAD